MKFAEAGALPIAPASSRPAATIVPAAVDDHQMEIKETALPDFLSVCERDGRLPPSTISDALLVAGV